MAAVSPSDENTGIMPASMRSARQSGRVQALAWTVGGLTLLALLSILPLGAPILLAAWVAIVAAPLCTRVARRVKERGRAAALLTAALVLLVLGPMIIIGLSLSLSAVELLHRLQESKSGRDALQALTTGDTGFKLESLTFEQAVTLARSHAGSALTAATSMFGAATAAVVGLVIFVGSFHAFLAQGTRLYQWLLDHAPLARSTSERFAAAFVETGRGLLVGVGGTALLQGAVATVGYVVTGVPQPFVLGLLTVFASLIPSIGSGLVWAPVAAGLALGGRTGAAAVMVAIGLFVSIVDNLVRPWLSRYGKLELPGFLLFVAMLGGIAAFGGIGLFIGPLFVRLAVEGLSMWRERERGHAPA